MQAPTSVPSGSTTGGAFYHWKQKQGHLFGVCRFTWIAILYSVRWVGKNAKSVVWYVLFKRNSIKCKHRPANKGGWIVGRAFYHWQQKQGHRKTTLKDYTAGIKTCIWYQRKSGDVTTFIGNTVIIAACLASMLPMEKITKEPFVVTIVCCISQRVVSFRMCNTPRILCGILKQNCLKNSMDTFAEGM